MIVLLNGLSRSGKDTVAKYLERSFNFTHLKISTPLKQAVSHMFGIPLEHLEDHRKDNLCKYGVTPRQLLKFMGTDVGQHQIEHILPGTNRCFWINRLMLNINEHCNYVVSDYRFIHEYDAIRNKFPHTPLRVIRVVPQYPQFKQPENMDESELTLPFDDILYNNTIEDLYSQISQIFTPLRNTQIDVIPKSNAQLAPALAGGT